MFKILAAKRVKVGQGIASIQRVSVALELFYLWSISDQFLVQYGEQPFAELERPLPDVSTSASG